jgi:two-component system, OmpR family, response regulator
MRLLLIEDDTMVSSWVKKLLEEEQHRVDVADTCGQGTRLATVSEYDLLIVDLELPDGSGISAVYEMRRAGCTTPIIVMTGRSGQADTVAALDAGADDYIVKPVPAEVLKARARAALRRGGAQTIGELRVDALRLDRIQRCAFVGAERLALTPRELGILEQLMLSAGQVVPRSDLLRRVWGITFDPGTNAVDVAVSRLRQKLGAIDSPRIETVRGVGFALTSAL